MSVAIADEFGYGSLIETLNKDFKMTETAIVPVKAVRKVLRELGFCMLYTNKLRNGARSVKAYLWNANRAEPAIEAIKDLMEQYGVTEAKRFKDDGFMVYVVKGQGYRGNDSLIVRLKGDCSKLRHEI